MKRRLIAARSVTPPEYARNILYCKCYFVTDAKQVVHARFRQAGMRWSEAGARRLLALRLLLLNENWALLDRLRMISLA